MSHNKDDGDEIGFQQYRHRLESMYFSDDFFEENIRERIHRDIDNNNNGDDTTWTSFSACGDDCDECEIPKELKLLPEVHKDLDVLAFLGIQRAEPLFVKKTDWE